MQRHVYVIGEVTGVDLWSLFYVFPLCCVSFSFISNFWISKLAWNKGGHGSQEFSDLEVQDVEQLEGCLLGGGLGTGCPAITYSHKNIFQNHMTVTQQFTGAIYFQPWQTAENIMLSLWCHFGRPGVEFAHEKLERQAACRHIAQASGTPFSTHWSF